MATYNGSLMGWSYRLSSPYYNILGGNRMGYEYQAVVVVDKVTYGEVNWENWKEYISEVHKDDTMITYRFNWSKRTYEAIEWFLDKIALREEPEEPEETAFLRNDTFGIIMLGEEDTDIEYYGEYWDYNIGLHRYIESY